MEASISKTMQWKEHLGLPDIKLAGLQIWIHGRQFEDNHDYSDGNWLRITAHCGAEGADVWATGSIIEVTDIERWHSTSKSLFETLQGEANLECIEPELSVTMKAQSLGAIEMEVTITPNHMRQGHWFQFDIDQSYLSPLIEQCAAILHKYPVRGNP